MVDRPAGLPYLLDQVNLRAAWAAVRGNGLAEGHSLLTFDGWYNGIRVWEEVMDADMVPAAVAVSCAEMIRTGTTTLRRLTRSC